MPALTIARQSSVEPSAEPRNVLGLKLTNGITHSPDGYFAHDEALARANRSSMHPDNIRFRSKTHLGHSPLPSMQDFADDDDVVIDPHAWRKPSASDSRSVCPALNTLANHAYLPRDGRDIGIWTLVRAMREGYGVSYVLAILFTVGSFIILRLGGVGRGWLRPTIHLEDLSAHNVLEHDGSLVHADAREPHDPPEGPVSSPRSRSTSAASSSRPSSSSHTSKVRFILTFFASLLFRRKQHLYLPCRPSQSLINALFADSASGTHLTFTDVARARVRRSSTCSPLPRHLSQFADAEFTLVLGIFGKKGEEPSVELSLLKEWLIDERLPSGWRPDHELGFWENHVNTTRVQKLMEGMRRYKQENRKVQSISFE